MVLLFAPDIGPGDEPAGQQLGQADKDEVVSEDCGWGQYFLCVLLSRSVQEELQRHLQQLAAAAEVSTCCLVVFCISGFSGGFCGRSAQEGMAYVVVYILGAASSVLLVNCAFPGLRMQWR